MADNSVGNSMKRVGGVDRTTGAQQYAADLELGDVLHVKLVTVDCARAKILSIDASAAWQVEGVRAVLTPADLPQPMPRYGPVYQDRPVLAVGETKFFGEPVAAVAAESLDAAREAARLVRVEYEELPPVLTVESSLDPASPLVQSPEIRPNDPLANTNILKEWVFDREMEASVPVDLVIENDYTFPMVTHFSIEPHVFAAAPDANGLVIWSPIQHSYILQRVVAATLGWPLTKVRIIAPDPGGGFGGKGWPKFEPLVAFLALKTGRTVRLVLTLEETFQAVRRAAARVHIKSGFARDGRIAFQDITADFLLGAYGDIGTRVVSKGGYIACGPYLTPRAHICARALLSHTTPSTAFRGFGSPQASWALESQLNLAAEALGIDRVEIRRRNLPARGEAFIPDETPADGHWIQALDRAAEAIGWGKPLARNRGRGLSLGLKSSFTVSASFAMVRLHADGSASVLSATSDMGQGARTIYTQLVAQSLGIGTDRVTIVMGDTSIVPFDSATSASRSTVFMGNAILAACEDIKTKLKKMAAELTGGPPDAITVEGGLLRAPGKTWTISEFLCAYYGLVIGEVIGIGESRSGFIPGHPLGGATTFWEFTATAADVEVDPGTGLTKIHKLVLVSDVGKALNPAQVEAQDEGGGIMGLGHSLMEQIILDKHGRILNLGALDYRIPTIQDIPLELESILIENGDGPGPFGAKGAGEGGTLALAAAIGAAINEAVGVEIRDLPLTPERIWRAIREKGVRHPPGTPEPEEVCQTL